jgi:type IV pilus assembly protein PilM
MGLKDLFFKKEALLGIDIGTSSVKLIELDISHQRPKLVNIAMATFPGEVISNNIISKSDKVAEQLSALLEENVVGDKRIVTAMPGPSVFTKKIKMPKMPMTELSSSIQFEAGNFIPHNIEAVRLDFHILGESQKNQLDVLVVAVKNEIVDSYLTCLNFAGLEPAVVDIDFFALQNMFELCYPDLLDKTVALVNIGARHTAINICREEESLFTGDIAVGGRGFSDPLVAELGVSIEEAEKIKQLRDPKHPQFDATKAVLAKSTEQVAAELNRQLSFFWNASGADEGIEKIMLCGGGALTAGLQGALQEKTGIECEYLDPLKGVDLGSSFEDDYLKELSPFMGVCVGLGLRQPGDRIVPALE